MSAPGGKDYTVLDALSAHHGHGHGRGHGQESE